MIVPFFPSFLPAREVLIGSVVTRRRGPLFPPLSSSYETISLFSSSFSPLERLTLTMFLLPTIRSPFFFLPHHLAFVILREISTICNQRFPPPLSGETPFFFWASAKKRKTPPPFLYLAEGGCPPSFSRRCRAPFQSRETSFECPTL